MHLQFPCYVKLINKNKYTYLTPSLLEVNLQGGLVKNQFLSLIFW